MVLQPGDVICSHVEVDAALDDVGAQVFGETFAARDRETSEDLWLTLISRRFLPGSADVSQFMAQANGLREVRHPSLVRLALVDREPEYCVIGYEWLPDAESVAQLVARGEPPAVEKCAMDVARALAFLHKRGLMHGMLSARTVLAWEGTHVLFQHGLAGMCDGLGLVQRCRRIADEVFAPEFVRGDPLTPVVDVFAWGVIVAELATGERGAEAVNALIHGIGDIALDPALLPVVRSALDSTPDQRPRDGVQLRTMLQEARPSGPVAAAVQPAAPAPVPPAPSTPPPPPPPRDSAADFSLGTGEFEVMGIDGGEPEPAPRPSPAKPEKSRPKAGDSSAALETLMEEHVGESALSNDGPAGVTKMPEDHLAAGEAALDAALVDARNQAPVGLGVPAPSMDPVHAPSAEPALEVEKGAAEEEFALPRLPGPHGPKAWVMATWLVVLTLGMVVGAAVPVVLRAGGVFAFVGLDVAPPPAPPPEVAEAGPGGTGEGETGAGGTGDDALVAAADVGAEDALPKLDIPGNENKHASCPKGSMQVSPKLCMDTGEFPGLMRVPRTHVAHRDAAAICEDRKGRLCRLKEWQRACRGPQGLRYSYGGVFVQDRCNTASIAGYPREVALSGSHEGCVSAQGLHDMVGNVGEWVAEGVAVGGDSTTAGAVATCAAKGRPPPGYNGADLGFRCCYELF